MARHKDLNWNLHEADRSGVDWNSIKTAVLMDIRDELKIIRGLMQCHNVQAGFIAMQGAAKAATRIDRRLATKIKL